MKIVYDPKADAINITFRTGKVRKSIELANDMILDMDVQSRPLHLEIIGAKRKIGKQSVEEITFSKLIIPGNKEYKKLAEECEIKIRQYFRPFLPISTLSPTMAKLGS